MNRKETLDKIKDSLKSLLKFSEEIKKEIKCAEFFLLDGTKIASQTEELQVGSEVYLIDDKGNQTPLNTDTYVLDDGRTIIVKDNVVVSIAETDVKEAIAEEEMEIEVEAPEVEAPEVETEIETEVPETENVLDKRVTDLEKQIEEILNILKKLSDTQVDVTEQMMSKIETFSKENGAEPIKSTKKGFTEYKKGQTDFKEKINEMLKLRDK